MVYVINHLAPEHWLEVWQWESLFKLENLFILKYVLYLYKPMQYIAYVKMTKHKAFARAVRLWPRLRHRSLKMLKIP